MNDPDATQEEAPAEETGGTDSGAGAETANADPDREFERGDALAVAIRENPEEVARFVERIGVVNELLDVAELGTAAMDDRMVQELSATAGNLGAAADAAATPQLAGLGEAVGENADDLAAALESMVRLQRTGTLDDLVALADAAALATAAMDDEMVTTLAAAGNNLGELADTAADEEVGRGLARVLEAVGEADAAEREAPRRVGMIGLVRAMRDPEVKAGLGYLLAVSRALGRDVEAGNALRSD